MRSRLIWLVAMLALALPACASLGALAPVVQMPRFEVAEGRQAEIRLVAPTLQRPLGGASVRLWARVQNPNPFGLTLSAVDGLLFLEGRQTAGVDFPLGLPLAAVGDTVIPLDVGISFADVPGMADVLRQALDGSPIGYRLDGSMRVDAGVLGQPSFGPTTLLQDTLHVRR